MTMPALPPLPTPAYGWLQDYYSGWEPTENPGPEERYHELYLFTEEQMTAYGQACYEAGKGVTA